LLERCIALVVCPVSAAVLCWPVEASAEDGKPVEQAARLVDQLMMTS